MNGSKPMLGSVAKENIYIKMGKVKQATINNLSGWLGRLPGGTDWVWIHLTDRKGAGGRKLRKNIPAEERAAEH